MPQTELLKFEDRQVRMTVKEGEPWWIAKDVCDILGLTNSRKAMGDLDDDEKGVTISDTLGGPQEVAIVNESGLYSLILRSRKPEAKAFKKWVTKEVLPSIRRNGIYISPTDEESPAFAATMGIVRQMTSIEYRMARIEEAQSEAISQAKELPAPLGVLPGVTNVDYIQKAAKVYCRLTGVPMKAFWAMLWGELGLRCKVNIRRRQQNAQWKGSTLSYAIHVGYADRVYALILEKIELAVRLRAA